MQASDLLEAFPGENPFPAARSAGFPSSCIAQLVQGNAGDSGHQGAGLLRAADLRRGAASGLHMRKQLAQRSGLGVGVGSSVLHSSAPLHRDSSQGTMSISAFSLLPGHEGGTRLQG